MNTNKVVFYPLMWTLMVVGPAYYFKEAAVVPMLRLWVMVFQTIMRGYYPPGSQYSFLSLALFSLIYYALAKGIVAASARIQQDTFRIAAVFSLIVALFWLSTTPLYAGMSLIDVIDQIRMETLING